MPIDDERATEALEAKLADIYANPTLWEGFHISGELTYDTRIKKLIKLENGEFALYYEVNASIPIDNGEKYSHIGGIVEVIVTMSD